MADDFSKLKEMKYSGRGITIGMTLEGNPFVGYTLTGRSPSSQARKLVYDKSLSTIRTDVTDQEQLKKGNPALLIYPAIIAVEKRRVVTSNGVQTKLLTNSARQMNMKDIRPIDILVDAMNIPVDENGIDITTYEPDAPNFTPRINGCLDKQLGGFYIVRKATEHSADVNTFSFNLEPGIARLITTYLGGNENPLLPFRDNPLEAKVQSVNASQICESLYDAIGPKDGNNYRVAVAIMMKKRDGLDVVVINRFDRGE